MNRNQLTPSQITNPRNAYKKVSIEPFLDPNSRLHYMRLFTYIALFTVLYSIYQLYKKSTMSQPTLPVVVVGSGLAGLTSVYKLLERKIPVILIDKMDKMGGNSIKASSGINGVLTSTQKQFGIEDSVQGFFDDTKKSGGKIGDLNLQQKLVKESTEAIRWLQQDIGVPLDLVNRLGGHSQRRTHRSSNIPPGFEIISKLKNRIVEHEENLKLLLNSQIVDIDISNGKIIGLKVLDLINKHEDYIKTNQIVMATGGFGFSEELIKKYRPELLGLPTTNGAQTLGEGQVLLEKIGAALIDMEQIQIHPTGFINPKDPESRWKFLAAESLRGIGGVLLNTDKNERFINELSTRDVVSQAILKQKDSKALLVLNDDMYQDFKFQLDFYIKQGLVVKTSVKDYFKENAGKVVDLLSRYSKESISDEFNRESKAHVFKEMTVSSELLIAEITPVVHFTMGGVKINGDGQVLDTKGDVIEGLYAVGEVSGGVHGANRLGGNSLLECVVFGTSAAKRIAGELGKL